MLPQKQTQKKRMSDPQDNPFEAQRRVELQMLSQAQQMTGYVVKKGVRNSANAPWAVIQNDESTIPILCKTYRKQNILLTDGGETLKLLPEPIYSYMEGIGKSDKLDNNLLVNTLKALVKKEIRIQNKELTIIIPSYDPSDFLSGCIALFACIKGVENLSNAISA